MGNNSIFLVTLSARADWFAPCSVGCIWLHQDRVRLHQLEREAERGGGWGAERDPVEQQTQAVAAVAHAWVQLRRELQIWFSYISCELPMSLWPVNVIICKLTAQPFTPPPPRSTIFLLLIS